VGDYPKKYNLDTIRKIEIIPREDTMLLLRFVKDGCFLFFSEYDKAVFRVLKVDDIVEYEVLSDSGTVDSPMAIYYNKFEDMLYAPMLWFDSGYWEVGYFIKDIRMMKMKQLLNE